MKKVFLAVILLIGITAFAQEKETRKDRQGKLTSEERVDFQVKRLTKDLDLNEKQAKDVRALVTAEVAKRDAKRAEMKEKREMNAQKRAEAKANMEKEQAAASAQMKKILTPEQFAKWEKNREERKDKMMEKMSERKEERRLDKKTETIKPE